MEFNPNNQSEPSDRLDLQAGNPRLTGVDLGRLRVQPLAQRRNLCLLEDILVDPNSPPPPCSPALAPLLDLAAARIRAARQRQASVVLMYGAHLLRNGAVLLLEQMMKAGWITHVKAARPKASART